MEKEIDLRKQPKGCREHPLIRLGKEASSLKPGEELRVVTDAGVIPLEAVKLVARRKGLEIKETRIQGSIVEAVLIRPREGSGG